MRLKYFWLLVSFVSMLVGINFFGADNIGAANFFEQIGKSAKKIGNDISEGAKNVGQEIGIVEKKPIAKEASDQKGEAVKASSTEKLPAGVTSRLKKITRELDQAEQAFDKSGGKQVDRATMHLTKARGLQGEINKNYAGQFSENHAEVATAFDRLDQLENRIAAAKGEISQTATGEAEPSKDAIENLCQKWDTKFLVYTQGDKPLHVYGTDDAALMSQWKSYYDESSELLDEYRTTPLNKDTCPQAEATIKLLGNYRDNFQAIYDDYEKKHAEAAANKGRLVFSKVAINPDSPSQLTSQFRAGDYIYGLIQTTQPWSKIYKNTSSANIRVDVSIDGKKIHAQFINLKDPALLERKFQIFEIAPDPKKMTAYSSPGIEYGKSTATMRQGPNELTSHLSQLAPGKHALHFSVQNYGTIWAEGDLIIEGKDFVAYAKLHTEIAEGVSRAVTLPTAKMINKQMTAEMEALLKNAGWSNVYRINIVDKDWWIDRMSGGNSPVKSRHMAAAALSKGSDDNYFYKICTFHQDMLITGNFGKLYLSHQGDAVPVPQENIDK